MSNHDQHRKDWHCDQCHYNNRWFRNECRRCQRQCGAEEPDEPPVHRRHDRIRYERPASSPSRTYENPRFENHGSYYVNNNDHNNDNVLEDTTKDLRNLIKGEQKKRKSYQDDQESHRHANFGPPTGVVYGHLPDDQTLSDSFRRRRTEEDEEHREVFRVPKTLTNDAKKRKIEFEDPPEENRLSKVASTKNQHDFGPKSKEPAIQFHCPDRGDLRDPTSDGLNGPGRVEKGSINRIVIERMDQPAVGFRPRMCSSPVLASAPASTFDNNNNNNNDKILIMEGSLKMWIKNNLESKNFFPQLTEKIVRYSKMKKRVDEIAKAETIIPTRNLNEQLENQKVDDLTDQMSKVQRSLMLIANGGNSEFSREKEGEVSRESEIRQSKTQYQNGIEIVTLDD